MVYEQAETMEKSDEQKMKLYANLGVCYVQTKKYNKALKVMKKALKISPNDDITLTNMGITWSMKGDNQKARQYLLQAKAHCTSDHQMEAIEIWLAKTK
ncbi:MAG: tetratricopeptide repeat protein [Bacteroidota bacterium]